MAAREHTHPNDTFESEWQDCAAGGTLLGKERGWRRRWEGDAGGIHGISYNYTFSFLKSPFFMIPRLGGGTTIVLQEEKATWTWPVGTHFPMGGLRGLLATLPGIDKELNK